MLGIVITIALFAASNGADPPTTIIETPLGLVEGTASTTVQGRTFYSFRGVRYAEPPIQELRFRPPVPVKKWNYTFDTTQDRPMCPQPGAFPTTEECLFMNIYTSLLPRGQMKRKRPVIVYFHAGWFYGQSGISTWAGPEYLLDHNVVLVTPNYRLGSLGFLSTGDSWGPGNNGLKDQVIALRWIKENIAVFGGDPRSVTIAGYGAGGISVTLHLVSPMSRGLFHKAVAMSGSALAQWPIPTNQFELAQDQARLVGCPHHTTQNIIGCLRKKLAKQIGDSLNGFSEFRSDPIIKWKPVIESDFGQERFLVEHPVASVQKGNFAQVPVILGITSKEFAYLGFDVTSNSTLMSELDYNFDVMAPVAFLYERYTERSRNISADLHGYYLDDRRLNNKSRSGIGKLYADAISGFGINRAAHLLSEKSNRSVYCYRFNYQGRYSHFYLPGTTTPYGVVHNDDLMYLFTMPAKFPKFNTTDPEYRVVKKFTKLFTNFAYTGNPTPSASADLDDVSWSEFKPIKRRYLEIGEKLRMKKNLYRGRYSEWEKLFPL